MKAVAHFLHTRNISHHQNEGITIVQVADRKKGITLAKELLYELVDKKTVLYLSGGSTPKHLYEQVATEEVLIPASVAMVDERYGKKFHQKSNETMLRQTGLLRYLHMRDIPFYPYITDNSMSREEASEQYDQQMRSLNATFQRSIAIMGIGADGHTAGIAPNRGRVFTNPMFDSEKANLLVSTFDDQQSMYGQRVSMTFLGISLMDCLIVLVFGEDKKHALELLFSQGSETEVPSRVYKTPTIAHKTLFITDQNV